MYTFLSEYASSNETKMAESQPSWMCSAQKLTVFWVVLSIRTKFRKIRKLDFEMLLNKNWLHAQTDATEYIMSRRCTTDGW